MRSKQRRVKRKEQAGSNQNTEQNAAGNYRTLKAGASSSQMASCRTRADEAGLDGEEETKSATGLMGRKKERYRGMKWGRLCKR